VKKNCFKQLNSTTSRGNRVMYLVKLPERDPECSGYARNSR